MSVAQYAGPGWSFVSRDVKKNLQQLVDTSSETLNPFLFSAVVNQTIASIPKSFPKNGDTFQIPVESADHTAWTSHEYSVEEIPLCSSKLQGNFFLDFVRDRIVMCAYGLTSTDADAPPLLLMPATTSPGKRGSLHSVMSAFTPFSNAGEFAYWSGRENLCHWLENKENVRGYGISQGGALLQLALHDYSHNFDQANILSAPGFVYGWQPEVGQKKVETRIYVQRTDPVSKVGYFPEGENVTLYTLGLQGPDYKSLSWWADLFLGWIAHFQDCLTTENKISITSSKNINAYNFGESFERELRTTVHKIISVAMFFLAPLIGLICEVGLLFSAGCFKLGELTRDSWHQLKRNEKLKSLCISVKNAVDAIVTRKNSSTSPPERT